VTIHLEDVFVAASVVQLARTIKYHLSRDDLKMETRLDRLPSGLITLNSSPKPSGFASAGVWVDPEGEWSAVACVNTSDSHTLRVTTNSKESGVRVLSTEFTDLFTLVSLLSDIEHDEYMTAIGTDGAHVIDLASVEGVTPKELLNNFRDVYSSELWDAPDILREMYPEPWLRTYIDSKLRRVEEMR
jgi:hypothetical protein